MMDEQTVNRADRTMWVSESMRMYDSLQTGIHAILLIVS